MAAAIVSVVLIGSATAVSEPASLSTAQQEGRLGLAPGLLSAPDMSGVVSVSVTPEVLGATRRAARFGEPANKSAASRTGNERAIAALRRYIALKHRATLQHTRLLGRAAFPTRHRWRTTRSVPYLRYLSALWQMRARASWLLVVDWRESFGGNPNVALGNQLARRYGWHHGAEWDALYRLWNHESGWDHTAHNRQGSGACGIPQSMSGCFGYSPRAQIAWGLSYIRGRYGRPTVALSHFYARNWY